MRVIPVEGEFVPHPQAVEQGYGHAHGQAGDIEERINLVAHQVAPGDNEIVLEHIRSEKVGWGISFSFGSAALDEGRQHRQHGQPVAQIGLPFADLPVPAGVQFFQVALHSSRCLRVQAAQQPRANWGGWGTLDIRGVYSVRKDFTGFCRAARHFGNSP
jgi:hypothetical protein